MVGARTMLWRARVAVSALFAVYGFLMTLWVVHIPDIAVAAAVSTPVLGVLVMLRVAGSIAVMQLAGPLADRVGTRRLAWAAAILLSLSVAGPGMARSPFELAAALVVFGMAIGGVDVAGNTQAVQIEREYGRPIMSSVHACFGCGAIAGALCGAGTQALHWDSRLTLGLAGGMGLAVISFALPWLLAPGLPAAPRPHTPWSRDAVALGMLAFAIFFATGTAYDWAALQLKDRLAVSDSVAALGIIAYSIALTAGRFSIDPVSHRLGGLAVLRAGTLLAVAGLSTVIVSSWVPATVAGWLLCGLGLAGTLPQVLSAAGTLAGGKATNISRVMGIGFCGLLAGPLTIGALTKLMPLTAALVAPAAVLLCCCWFAGTALRPNPSRCLANVP